VPSIHAVRQKVGQLHQSGGLRISEERSRCQRVPPAGILSRQASTSSGELYPGFDRPLIATSVSDEDPVVKDPAPAPGSQINI
jgi:hypothetical protein